MTYYPLVGLGIGLILVLANHLFAIVLPQTVVAILLVILLVLLTGALHLAQHRGIRVLLDHEARRRVLDEQRAGAHRGARRRDDPDTS